MIQPSVHLVEEGSKRDWRAKAQEICVSTCLIGDLCKVILPPIDSKEAAAVVAHTWRIDRVDDHSGALGSLNRRIHVGIHRTDASKAINAIRNYQDFSTNGAFRPSFDQILDRQIETAVST